jgi:hypothetical protein
MNSQNDNSAIHITCLQVVMRLMQFIEVTSREEKLKCTTTLYAACHVGVAPLSILFVTFC